LAYPLQLASYVAAYWVVALTKSVSCLVEVAGAGAEPSLEAADDVVPLLETVDDDKNGSPLRADRDYVAPGGSLRRLTIFGSLVVVVVAMTVLHVLSKPVPVERTWRLQVVPVVVASH